MRLDTYLVTYWPEYSRSLWQKYCKAGYVSVNGKPVTSPSQYVGEDDVVTYNIPQLPDTTKIPIPILYEDNDVIVINKPAGVLTHAKGALQQEFTVADFIRPHTTDGLDTNRPGIVHRLDRGTSGVLIAAKTPEAKRWLQKQFAERKVKKIYTALVAGVPKQPEALLDLPIERNPKKPQTFRVGSNGKAAQTRYVVEKQFKKTSLVNLYPLTGRTHQLRVHMQYIGCPIIGDIVYGAPDKHLNRLFLHAASLEITLPSKTRSVFTATLPPDLQEYISQITT